MVSCAVRSSENPSRRTRSESELVYGFGGSYCDARPTHEYLGWNAGLDFESKILVKPRAPELFCEWLAQSRYDPQVVVLSGVHRLLSPSSETGNSRDGACKLPSKRDSRSGS